MKMKHIYHCPHCLNDDVFDKDLDNHRYLIEVCKKCGSNMYRIKSKEIFMQCSICNGDLRVVNYDGCSMLICNKCGHTVNNTSHS